MKSPLFTGSPCPDKRSAVLIVVLAFLVFLCLIIISLTLVLQTESQAAHYYAARNSADLLAQQGVEYVRAALVTAEQSTNNWATAPGVIYYWPTNTTTLTSYNSISLSSGPTNGTASGIYAPPDLNRVVYSEDSLTAITGATTTNEMSVGWIYVYQNGNETTNQSPTISTANPIIGRFAYWADDESSRINLNTAYQAANNTNSLNHPSRIDLPSLFGSSSFAQEIYTNALVACFNSPDDARRIDPNLAPMISTNRFSLTHDSYSQNLNPWGLPKIILTTQQRLAGTNNGVANTNFLNILNTPNLDPGPIGNCNLNITTTGVPAVVNLISDYLTNNWPGYGTSFAQKYAVANQTATQTANQMALNIIDYVRSVESTNLVCDPIRGNLTPTLFDQSAAGTESLSSIFGTSRHPLITEVGCWIEPTPTYVNGAAKDYRTYISAELYLPTGYGTNNISVPGNQVYYLEVQEGGLSDEIQIAATGTVTSPTTATSLPIAWVSGGAAATSGVLSPGQFCVVTLEYEGGGNPASVNFPSGQYPGRVSFKDSGGVLWDVAPIGFPGGTVSDTGLELVINSAQWSATYNGFVMEVNDPRVNKNKTDWTSEHKDTMGNQPLPWLTTTNTTPPQDTVSGIPGTALSTNSLYFPGPATNVQSVADLGYVTTGVNIATNGVPWRSVRLQPTPVAYRTLPPDWALLDLFQAPLSSTNHSDLYQPETTSSNGLVSLAGLVNINSSLYPFTNNPAIVRTAPLVALFTTATNVTATNPAFPGIAATNVGSITLAANGTNYGAPVFVSPGELAEVQGLADGGEATESNLRGVVDLAAVRGSTFRVFSIGQTLKQTPAGALVLQAEQYKEAIILQDSRTRHDTVLWKNISQ